MNKPATCNRCGSSNWYPDYGAGVVCRVCARESRIRYRLRDPAAYSRMKRRQYIERKYGISVKEYDRRLKRAGTKCRLCRTRPPTNLDHNHTTGALRQFLCWDCNSALGKFHDSVTVLRRAVRYLEKFR